MKTKINIGIADDHSLVRDGFVSILRSYPHVNIMFEANNGVELLNSLNKSNPDIVLLDIGMPVLDGIGAMLIMRKKFPTIKIMVISGHSEPKSIIEYIKLGAISFLPKDCNKATLIKAIQIVSEIGTFFERDIYALLEEHGLFPDALVKKRKLSENELTVLKLLCENKTMTEISELMSIKLVTVGTYRHTLFRKTNTNDLNTLKKYATKNQLL